MPSDIPVHVRARIETREARLQSLGFATYREFLRSDRWQATRRRYYSSQMPQECVCGDDDTHLHHLTYERLGEESLSDLMPLCRKCHAMVHELERRGDIRLDLAGLVLDEDRAEAGRAQMAVALARKRQEDAEFQAAQQAEVLALSFAARLVRVVKVAETKRMDVSRQVWVIGNMASRGKPNAVLTRNLRWLEEDIYDWQGWGEQSRAV